MAARTHRQMLRTNSASWSENKNFITLSMIRVALITEDTPKITD